MYTHTHSQKERHPSRFVKHERKKPTEKEHGDRGRVVELQVETSLDACRRKTAHFCAEKGRKFGSVGSEASREEAMGGKEVRMYICLQATLSLDFTIRGRPLKDFIRSIV